MNKLSTSTSGRRMRWRLPLIAALIAGLGGGGWMFMHAKDSNAVEKKDAKAEKKQEIFELTRADFATVEARELRVALPVSGTLTPLNQATVKSKVAAEVRETLVQEGMPVARGQAVVRLDTADLAARVATQQAALEEAKARLSLAQKTQESNHALLKQKYISQNAFDTAASQVELAQAAVKSAAAQLDIARRALEDATVRAPFDGIVSKRLVQTGEKVAPDMPLFALVDLKQLIFEAQVPASEIPRVKPGQAVAFHVDGYAGRTFNGKVARINPAAEAGSRSMTVYIEVANKDGALKGGMFAKGGITLEKSEVMPLVPVTALRQDGNAGGAPTVYKIDNGKVVAQPVKLGLRNEDEGMAEVTSGLAAGNQVIIVKLDGVKPGSSVKLPESDAVKQAASAAGRKG
ncbi:MAG TPA: efflux RND transporter periplasmic adaptor subunit [Paucimonas sp.]|nr:efflux RND transporter periplasmic adaptor subunit [Paucimonas sp.]